MKKFFGQLSGPKGCLALLLIVSLGLRLVIVFRGGEYFWGDEVRYGAATSAWDDWYHGNTKKALLQVVGTADHLGFKVLALLPAWLQIRTGAQITQPACFFALFSVANIFLVWRIARRAGADEREALWAAVAMASSASMFYWARHLVPYDVALFWALLCTYVVVKPEARWFDSLLAGGLGFMAFVTYNGYWALAGCALTAHVLLGWPRWGQMVLRAGCGLVGLAGSFALLLLATDALGVDLPASYTQFAGSISQGDFAEGHVVFFDYLWRVERLTALGWAAALLAAGWLIWRSESGAGKRGALWVALIVALAAILIMGANVFEKFVVYGRLVRQVVPFFALLTGWTAAQIFRGRAPWSAGEKAALAVWVACGAWSLSVPLRQEFPLTFFRKASIALQAYRDVHAKADPVGTMPEKFRFTYNGFIWPVPAEPPLTGRYDLLLAAPHPLSWRPYLYEGFNRDQRERIETTDITMRLVLLKD